jgi:hypothetical protein
VRRFGSIRFDGAFGSSERAAAVRSLSSVEVAVTSWNVARGVARTYALLQLPDGFDAAAPLAGLPPVLEPAPLVLEVTPRDRARIGALRHALAGPGRPAGVLDATASAESILLEIDESRTSLRLVTDLITAETGRAGCTIVPLLGLRDETLAAFAGATLGAPDMHAARLLETFSETLPAVRA